MCVQEMSQSCFLVDIIPQRSQYLNAQNTFHELFNMDVIPIVNENDTLAVSVSQKCYSFDILLFGKENLITSSRKSNLVTMIPSRP